MLPFQHKKKEFMTLTKKQLSRACFRKLKINLVSKVSPYHCSGRLVILDFLRNNSCKPCFKTYSVLNFDSVLVFDTGSMYAADDPIILRAEGLDKPRKKRGRPKKVVLPELEVLTDNAISNNLEATNGDCAKKDESTDKEEELDGRRRRKRRVPQRYNSLAFYNRLITVK